MTILIHCDQSISFYNCIQYHSQKSSCCARNKCKLKSNLQQHVHYFHILALTISLFIFNGSPGNSCVGTQLYNLHHVLWFCGLFDDFYTQCIQMGRNRSSFTWNMLLFYPPKPIVRCPHLWLAKQIVSIKIPTVTKEKKTASQKLFENGMH